MPSRNPLKSDPSRTATLRRQFSSDMLARMLTFKKRLIELIEKEDAFGLKDAKPLNLNSEQPFLLICEEYVENTAQHLYSSTHVKIIDPYVLQQIEEVQSRLILKDVLKLEDEAHITALYGLHTDQAQEVSGLVKESGSIRATLGRLSLFQNEDADVLKIDVESRQLEQLHYKLRLLDHTLTHHEYQPHLTIAYLKPGTGAKYLSDPTMLEHQPLDFDELIFSDKERNQTSITLNFEGSLNTRWKFNTAVEKLTQFRTWIDSQVGSLFFNGQTEASDDVWWRKYIQDGFMKGAGRAFDQLRGYAEGMVSDFYKGGRYEFLRSAFAQPETVEKVQLLASRVFTDLKGVTDAMASQISRDLADGLAQGQNPREIAQRMSKSVEKIGENRSLTIARTEIIRAHAEGQLDAMEKMGVERVGVMVEWAVSRDRQGNPDERVCDLCYPLNGVVLTLKESHGLIPRHPNCRCAFLPAQVGEKLKGIEKKDFPSISRALDKSIEGEISIKARKAGRTLEEQRKRSRWAGADAKISQTRPKSILDD